MVVGYELPGDLCILGRYEYFVDGEGRMGGLDGFKPYVRMWEELIPNYTATYEHCIFESIMISSNVGRARDLYAKYGGVFAFMDTPADECVRRIYARNGDKPIKEKVVTDAHKRMGKVKVAFHNDGIRVASIHDGRDLENLLRDNGWSPGVGV